MIPLKSISYIFSICLILLLGSFSKVENKTDLPKSDTHQNTENQKRKSITFIMGEDEKTKNQYYAEAANFYRYNEQERTDVVIDTCQSLWSIKTFLEDHRPTNGLPWGDINIVVHSNEWTGLSMPVFPNGERINSAVLMDAHINNHFIPIPSEVADGQTRIDFKSCGLGRNELLVNALQELFLNDECAGTSPKVTASPYFLFYESAKYKGIPTSTKKSKAEVWYAFYKTGYREGDIKLSRQLSKRYPNATVNWRKALKHKSSENSASLFHYNFTIPIEWTVTYETESDRPNLVTKESQQKWLANQLELQAELAAYGIEMDKFRWQFKEIDYTFEDGVVEPAIQVKGKCTVVCILQNIDTNT